MLTILSALTNALQADDRLVIDGKLAKNKIVELALNLDPELLKLLLADEQLKKHFFKDIDGVLIFDKVAFQRFVNNKSFLPDSYTEFKNKIGLSDNSHYLAESNDIVLAWPYKDCVLEGGQTKEDQKRNEIFWNETLAPEQVDTLLAPKALTNFKKFDSNGEHTDFELSQNDNLIIKGNNLLALHSLMSVYRGKVDLIYIDPPFNTEHDSFLYNDKFNRSTWLTFMKNRLEAAKELLSDSGTIYVHIDHNEGHYLKVMMDEIFGKGNFRNEIIWRYSGWNKKLRTGFERRHDTIFMYGKSDNQYFESYFEKWGSKEEYVKKRKQKLLTDEDGREYVLSDAGNGKRAKMFIEDVLEKGVVVDDVWDLDKLNNSAKESVGFTSQKRETLLERIIKASCPEGGIVLDYHLGSGTTAATAHKLNRRYIGVEQMDYINEISVPRLQNVISGDDQQGISKDVNWQGGGSFVYCELADLASKFSDLIEQAQTTEQLIDVWNDLKNSANLSYKVDPALFDENREAFNALEISEQKKLLIEFIDKNQLYVNYSEIDDKTNEISENDKKLNKQFYGA
ncbi:TPA: site-specific DNA-methyltransferase [Vibrio parahaemolyticus]|uniref:DNA methyltransferase n=1 Tax=Vibrio parahaemolyticus TaxID=670 RepID=UPI00204E81CB|nr:site-specific DNA-methyltransferase [Vibrio parahaemolyticus]MDF5005899.1 site-specific DNA-methyltransferase [Vibrio parahaemolyticus]UPR18541.1 site-specific DNA-methyltransferase [Vibrio parahaemolyticus]UPR22905.1 site-specific DNA-methyltransferase [Vibrio parahaemolyticus]HAV1517886.1 site-specific DNA-methyltransferase [Vibrio parahaemolyticus]HAV1536852.1 site-specific DNA-methyltransferase [Vibrio parahaemolyticus]